MPDIERHCTRNRERKHSTRSSISVTAPFSRNNTYCTLCSVMSPFHCRLLVRSRPASLSKCDQRAPLSINGTSASATASHKTCALLEFQRSWRRQDAIPVPSTCASCSREGRLALGLVASALAGIARALAQVGVGARAVRAAGSRAGGGAGGR